METLFVAFALVTSVCLAVWAHRQMGCVGAIIIFVVAIAVLGFAEKYVRAACKWRDERLAEKARQAEVQKAQEAESARIAEEKRLQERSAAEIRRKQAEAVAAAKRREESKDEKIRTFALKDAPKVWAVYQSLQSEIGVQNGKIAELRKTLEEFGKSPEEDTDFVRICAMRDEMIRSRTVLRQKLEDAYLAEQKYQASPSRKDYQEQHKKALEDGILEADAVEAKFKNMRLNK